MKFHVKHTMHILFALICTTLVADWITRHKDSKTDAKHGHGVSRETLLFSYIDNWNTTQPQGTNKPQPQQVPAFILGLVTAFLTRANIGHLQGHKQNQEEVLL